MNRLIEILELFQVKFQSIGQSVVDFLPNILLSIIIIIIGWYIAKILWDVVKKIIAKIGLDDILRKSNLERFLQKAGYKLNSGKFFGEVLRWFVFIGFFIIVLDILELHQIKIFTSEILHNIGNIIIAMIIFVVAVVVARFVKNIVTATAKAIEVKTSEFIGSLAAFLVYLLATVTILGLFPIFQNMVKYIDLLVMGIIFALALAAGLSFGMGGKEKARECLEKMKK